MILFLDFDGVLHPWDPKTNLNEKQMFSLKPLLENTLRNFPDVEIVITSSWRQKYSLEKLRHLFSAEFSSRIIGVTPPTRRDERGRYQLWRCAGCGCSCGQLPENAIDNGKRRWFRDAATI